MTYRDWMMENHPEYVDKSYGGGCRGCPDDHFRVYHICRFRNGTYEECKACWDREIAPGAVTIEGAESAKSKMAVPYEEEAEHEDCSAEGKAGMSRAEILDTAKQTVCGHREQDYGTPEDNFTVIARMWEAYLNVDVDAKDVAMMMCLFKIGRIMTGTATKDSFVDLAGYAACGAEIALGGV